MLIAGRLLNDRSKLRIQLTQFFGLGHKMAPKILQRLSIPYRISVGNLTEAQATALNGYLTSPAISDLPPSTRVVDPMGEIDLLPGEKEWEKIEGGAAIKAKEDWGRSILLETDLKKKVNDTIQTLYRIGTYRGYRHSMNLPIKTRTMNNGGTARRMNKLNRFSLAKRNYSTLFSKKSL